MTRVLDGFMTWVKICGMTCLEDALVAVEAGADAVGFVFYEKSPRNVTVEEAREICEKLPEGVEKIGVFVNGELDSMRIVLNAGLTGSQTYFSEGANAGRYGKATYGQSLLPKRMRFLMALPMRSLEGDEEQIQGLASSFAKWRQDIPPEIEIPEGMMETFVLDSGNLVQPGGTGKKFDWHKAVPVAEGMRAGGVKLVVAGGLTPKNVTEAMGILKPWGVDVVSGVESSPGKKDPEKVRAFVRAVREMDRKVS
jgi:phosphoribosylanthranilate isomerase